MVARFSRFALLALLSVVAQGSANLKDCMKENLAESVCLDGLRLDEPLSFKHSDFGAAVKRGWWEVAKEVILLGKENGMDFESEVDMEHRVLKQKLDKLKATAQQPLSSDSYITPAFQWAQSKDTLFFEVKFAHKMDAPSYANTKITNVTFTTDTMNLTATGRDKNFKLDLHFFKFVVPEDCTWSASSAGRITVNVPKQTPGVSWSRPLKGKQPQNMLVWWAMKEKFEKEMDAIEKPTTKAKPFATDKKAEDAKKGEKTEDAKTDDKKSTPQSESQKQLQANLKKISEEAKEKIESHEKEARAKKKSIDEDSKSQKSTIEKELKELKISILKEAEEKKNAEKTAIADSHEEL